MGYVITYHILPPPLITAKGFAQIKFHTFSFARAIGIEFGIPSGNARTVNKI